MKPDSFLAYIPRERGSAAGSPVTPADLVRLDLQTGSAFHFHGRPDNAHVVLPDDRGLIWGRLFERDGKPVTRVDPGRALGWCRTGGRALLERQWGSYLALLQLPGSVIVLRDPSAVVPCYIAETTAGWVLASDAALIAQTGLVQLGIDWDEILSQAQYLSLRTARTALVGVRELLPGTALVVEHSAARVETLWTPYPFAAAWQPDSSHAAAAEGLRRVVEQTVGAWARIHPRAVAEVSGGLDSSIVTACLASAGAEVRCFSFRGRQADLDETRYARSVADALGFPLEVEPLDSSLVDLTRSASARLARPTARAFSQAGDVQLAAFGRATAADAFFSGGSGDTIFWYFNTVIPALDRLAVDGVGGFLQTLDDLARMCGVARVEALRIALRKLVQRRPRPWPHDLTFLAPALRSPAPMAEHPWLPAPKGTHRGVRAYVHSLIQMQDHHEYHDRATVAPLIAPLYSQPLMEYCLGVPSWLWCAGGRNRAVAREAFAGRLPPQILERSTKGGFDGFSNELLVERRALARAMLLEGHLARRGMLDVTAIDRTLSGEQPIGDLAANRLLRLVSIEAWLGHWA